MSVEDAAACSPLQLLNRVEAGKSLGLPQTRVAVGSAETSEFVRQSRVVHHALQPHTKAGFRAVLLEVTGAAHFDVALAFDATGHGFCMLNFIRQALIKDLK